MLFRSPLASGSTILCVAAGTIAGPVNGDGVDDLTVVVGNSDNATTLTSGSSSTAVILSGAGVQTLTVTNTDSVVTGTNIGAYIEVGEGAGALIVDSQGTISGGSTGIQAINNSTGVTSITTADVTGGTGSGIVVYSHGGDVTVNTAAGTVTGGSTAIHANNYSTGVTSITTADVTGGTGSAIVVNNYGGDVTVNTAAGTVTGGGYGVYVNQFGIGDISITTADVTAGSRAAVLAWTSNETAGDVLIDTTAGTLTSGGSGITAYNNGNGDISITTADVFGGLDGIYVGSGRTEFGEDSSTTFGGDIVINTTAGSVTGRTDGIDVVNEGLGGISITTGNVASIGFTYEGNTYAYTGIEVSNSSYSLGGVTINTVAGTVVGGEAGIAVENSGAGGISITTADVSATGNNHGEAYTPSSGAGIFAVNNSQAAGDIVVNTTAGTVTAASVGIYAVNAGQGDISITTADVSGVIGIAAINAYGESASLSGITVNTVAGTIVGNQTGILVWNVGAGGINISTADVSAPGGDFGESSSPFNGYGITAINLYGSSGGIVIDSRAGDVSGESVGIVAANQGAGSITVATRNVTGGYVGIEVYNGDYSEGGIVINSAGTVSGDDTGIRARAAAGDISITAHNVTSATGPAIDVALGSEMAVFARSPIGVTGDLVVNTSGTVVGGTSGILLNNFGTGSSTLNNAGVLSATDGPAILAFGTPATVNNSGTLNGFITLTGGDDRFNNTGRFNVGVGNDFGAGADVFNNRGTVAVTTQAPVELTGLESFNNSGLVDLRNGQTGTVLTLPGDYVGSGNATVALDIENGPSGPTSDVLVIAGAATGQTGIVVNVLGSAGNELLLENLLLVDAGAGSSASAFTIATGFEEQGFLRLGVKQDAAANNYVLVLGPSLAAHRTSMYAEGMRNLWYKTADSWSRHMASVRNTQVEPGTVYWISAVGEFSERANKRAIAFNDSTQIHDFGYNQDYFGAQLGVDLNSGTGFNFGITGGYLSSTQKFNGSTDRVKYNSVNIGAYAGLTSGIVFANVLAKYDRVWADARSLGGRFDQTLDGGVYGGRAEAGLTFGDAATGFYAEPSASISYIGSDLDRLVTEQGSVEFVEDEGLLGKFGGRVGYAGFAGTSLYLGANLVREFAGDDSVNLRTAGRSFSLANYAERNYAETMVGLNLGDPTGTASGVFELRYSDGGDRKGFGGSATVNFKF